MYVSDARDLSEKISHSFLAGTVNSYFFSHKIRDHKGSLMPRAIKPPIPAFIILPIQKCLMAYSTKVRHKICAASEKNLFEVFIQDLRYSKNFSNYI